MHANATFLTQVDDSPIREGFIGRQHIHGFDYYNWSKLISFQTSIVQIHSLSNKRFHALIVHLIVGASTSVRRETLLITRLLVSTTGLGSTSGTLLDNVAFVDSILIIALCNRIREILY
jgi:hypothetical protein